MKWIARALISFAAGAVGAAIGWFAIGMGADLIMSRDFDPSRSTGLGEGVAVVGLAYIGAIVFGIAAFVLCILWLTVWRPKRMQALLATPR
jgi:hypothetical protein